MGRVGTCYTDDPCSCTEIVFTEHMPIYCSLKRKKLKKEKEAGNDACKKVIPKAMELFSRRR